MGIREDLRELRNIFLSLKDNFREPEMTEVNSGPVIAEFDPGEIDPEVIQDFLGVGWTANMRDNLMGGVHENEWEFHYTVNREDKNPSVTIDIRPGYVSISSRVEIGASGQNPYFGLGINDVQRIKLFRDDQILPERMEHLRGDYCLEAQSANGMRFAFYPETFQARLFGFDEKRPYGHVANIDFGAIITSQIPQGEGAPLKL